LGLFLGLVGNDKGNCNDKGKGEIQGSFAALKDDDVKQATATATATATADPCAMTDKGTAFGGLVVEVVLGSGWGGVGGVVGPGLGASPLAGGS
jgi:hypothetical protein